MDCPPAYVDAALSESGVVASGAPLALPPARSLQLPQSNTHYIRRPLFRNTTTGTQLG